MPANPPDPLRRLLLRLLAGGALATSVPWPARADGGDDDDEVDDHDNSGPGGGGDEDSDSDDDGDGDNSGPGGGDDDAEEDDRDDDGGEPDNSGGGPDGEGPEGVEDDSGGSGGDRPGTGRRARAVRDVTVFYPDGWIERIEDGTYELIDHHRRRVIARPATPEDFARMIALR